ncbi:MAG: DMT family transporter [Pseudomonadota bacterium]
MNAREVAILLAMCLVWGFHFVVIKLAVNEAPPILYAAMRMTLAAALTARFLKWRAGEMAPVLCAGLCLGVFNYVFMFYGVKYATASAAAIAMELYVPFATILSVVFLGDRIGWRRMIGIVLAFLGVAVIALGDQAEANPETRLALGVGLVAAGALVEGVGAVLVKKAEGFKPIELLAWFAFVGMIGSWIMTGLVESNQMQSLGDANKLLLTGAIIYSAVGASIFGHTAYYWLIKRLPLSLVAPSVMLTTLIAVIFGVVLLGDPFGPRMVIGGALVLSGVGVVVLRNARKQEITAPLEEPGAMS